MFRKESLTYKHDFTGFQLSVIFEVLVRFVVQTLIAKIRKCRYLFLTINRVFFLSVVLYFKKIVKKLLRNFGCSKLQNNFENYHDNLSAKAIGYFCIVMCAV